VLTRPRLREWLEERFFLRWHMTFILGGTFLAGLVMTRVLMLGGVNNLAVRYVVAVAAAYLAFLVLIRLWLVYVGSGHTIDLDLIGDAADIALSSGNGPRFHGGGSSGSWSGPDLDLGGDLEDIVLVVILVVIVVCLCGFAIYFIYTAPALLSEAAFEAALAGALARRTRKATGPGWIGAVWRATLWPFAIVLVLSGLLGWGAQRACPAAKRLSEALSCASHTPR
jgi:hypothetical protein